MPWFKVDDGFHGHPKVVEVTLEAVGLWTLAGSWCAKYLTDGFVPEKTIRRLGGSSDMAAELVNADLWSTAGDGYQFKDWGDYQPLKADVEAERTAAQERMRKVRASRKGVRANETRTDDEPTANVTDGSAEVRVTPSQSQSLPIPASSSTKKETPSATRGARLDPSWLPSKDLVAAIRAECPDIDPQREHAEFVDYWIAVPGARGVKVDWPATWRNWMRRKQRDHQTGRRKPKDEQIVDVLEMGRRMQAEDDRKAIGA